MLARIVLTFVLCVFATGIIRHGPLESAGARIAIALLWIVGVGYMVWTIAKKNRADALRRKRAF